MMESKGDYYLLRKVVYGQSIWRCGTNAQLHCAIQVQYMLYRILDDPVLDMEKGISTTYTATFTLLTTLRTVVIACPCAV